jgi:NTE family protein
LPRDIRDIPQAQQTIDKIRDLAERRQGTFERLFVPYEVDGTQQLYLSNVVFQGGGVLGLAHVGFLAGLEAAGIRCAGLAGTSAGAIVATAVACVRRTNLRATAHPKLFDLLATMPMASFIDGPPPVKNLIRYILSKGAALPPGLWPAAWTALRRLLAKRGLNPGLVFESWLESQFTGLEVPTSEVLREDLKNVRLQLERLHVAFARPNKLQDGKFVEDSAASDALSMLRVVATGLPSGLKITFPEDLAYLDPKYGQASPAIFVRASMAIPAFFEPKELAVNGPLWRSDAQERLKGLVARNQIADVSSARNLYLVDGGLLSNVPVDAFELMNRPRRGRNGQFVRGSGEKFPTIVATLVGWKKPKPEATWASPRRVLDDILRLAQAVRLQRDRDAWRRVLQTGNRSVRVVEIDTSEHNWLNFSMNDHEKARLFLKGLDRAHTFIRDL